MPRERGLRVVRKLWISLFSAQVAAAGVLLLGPADVFAQRAAEGGESSQQETRRTPAMRETVYQRLAEAQECVENEDYACARQRLDQIARIRDLNSYETAQMWYFHAFIHFNAENYADAIGAYEKVLEQPDLPISLEQDTKLALAQLYVQQEQYDKGLAMLEEWFKGAENPGTTPYVLKAQIHYQLQQYREGIPAIQRAIEITREQGRNIEESWYQLLNVFYFELEDYPKVIETLTILANNWPKKDYIVQLAGIYGQEGQEDRRGREEGQRGKKATEAGGRELRAGDAGAAEGPREIAAGDAADQPAGDRRETPQRHRRALAAQMSGQQDRHEGVEGHNEVAANCEMTMVGSMRAGMTGNGDPDVTLAA